MERPERQRAPRLAALAVIGSIAVAGCSENGNRNVVVEIPDIPGCDLPDHREVEEVQMPDVRRIVQHNSRNPVQRSDIVELNINETREQLSDFQPVHRSQIAGTGITLSIYSEGELEINETALHQAFLAPLEIDYGLPRLDATMECITEWLYSGELEGHEIRSYVSADPRNCINSLRLTHREVTAEGNRGECHATGGSMPQKIKELSLLQDMVILESSQFPLVVAPGATSPHDYPVELLELEEAHANYPSYNTDPNRRLNEIWLHEIIHTQRWMKGASYSILNPNTEEDLVKHIDQATSSYLYSLEDYELPLSYTCDQLLDWPHADVDC